MRPRSQYRDLRQPDPSIPTPFTHIGVGRAACRASKPEAVSERAHDTAATLNGMVRVDSPAQFLRSLEETSILSEEREGWLNRSFAHDLE